MFRAYRYAADYVGFQGKDLIPGKTLVEVVDEAEKAKEQEKSKEEENGDSEQTNYGDPYRPVRGFVTQWTPTAHIGRVRAHQTREGNSAARRIVGLSGRAHRNPEPGILGSSWNMKDRGPSMTAMSRSLAEPLGSCNKLRTGSKASWQELPSA